MAQIKKRIHLTRILIIPVIIFSLASCTGKVIVYPAPDDEPLNMKYKVKAEGQDVPVYNIKVGAATLKGRGASMKEKVKSHQFYELAGMAYFDMREGPVRVTVRVDDPVWSSDDERGHIKDISFKNITLKNAPSKKGIEFLGFDKEHAIENVLLENITIGGKKVVADDVVTNEFVSGLVIK